MDKQHQCRLCLNKTFNMHNIIVNPISTDNGISIPESVFLFFDIKIEKNDNYSKLLCPNCLSIIHLLIMYRKRFIENQKKLSPLFKEEADSILQNDDGPPVLHPYFGFGTSTIRSDRSTDSESGISSFDQNVFQTRNNSFNNSSDENNPLGESESHTNGNDYIWIPKKFLNEMAIPKVKIKSEDLYLANLALYGNKHAKETMTERKRRRMRTKYLRNSYNIGRPGGIRELIQEKARRDLYISEIDNEDLRLRSIYEYDVNLKPQLLDPWKLRMELCVFVCNMCNEVFYSKTSLSTHKKVHETFKEKMAVWNIIF